MDLTTGQEHVRDCIGCGLCLESCPTYVLWGQEADSPRGRIALIGEAIAAGGVADDQLAVHTDRCLGCMACVSACPSGVSFDQLLARARPAVERHRRRPAPQRAARRFALATLPHPRRLRAVAGLVQAADGPGRRRRVPDAAYALANLVPAQETAAVARSASTPIPASTPARSSPPRGRVGLLLGCQQRLFFEDVQLATIEVLAAEGYEVFAPELPECCGALERHAGEQRAGLNRAQQTIQAFSALGGIDHIVTTSGVCGGELTRYGDLLGTPQARAFSAIVRDVTELLTQEPSRARRGPLPMSVAYHASCQLEHAQGVHEQPLTLLREIPDLEVLQPAAHAYVCCGGAGLTPLLQPQTAAELGGRAAAALTASRADAVVTCSHECSAHLSRHLRGATWPPPPPVVHPVQLVRDSIRAARQA
jgi:glycolate oxidase iron-sulfur subunit